MSQIASITVTFEESTVATVTTNTGPKGDAATIAVGTVTTGAAGSSAAVVNSGTTGAAVFDFTIPRGNTGATGATGATGPGVPAAGTTGQALRKTSDTDYATEWFTLGTMAAQDVDSITGIAGDIEGNIFSGAILQEGGPPIATLQWRADGRVEILRAPFYFRVSFPAYVTENRDIFYPDASGTIQLTAPAPRTVTSATDIVSTADSGGIIVYNYATEITVTLDNEAPAGTNVLCIQKGAGKALFTAEAGGTLVNVSDHTRTQDVDAMVSLVVISNTGTDAAWVLGGSTSA